MSESNMPQAAQERKNEAQPPSHATPIRDWRFAVIVGLSIGVAIPIARNVGPTISPSLGYVGSTIVSAVLAGLAAGIVALVVGKRMRLGGKP